MNSKSTDYPIVIVGAGAAGLGASEQATKSEIEHVVLEASHRIGGRGLTEYLQGGIAVDLGCHWMHSASINPYVQWADTLGFDYAGVAGFEETPGHRMYCQDWLQQSEILQYQEFMEKSHAAIEQLYKQHPLAPVSDAIDGESRWANQFYYWLSLMHSNDADQVAVCDVMNFTETGEDWPVKQGYGALIAEQGKNAPVQLNTEVTKIDSSGGHITLQTNHGVVTTQQLILTVSTGVLGAGQIEFFPQLPQSKRDAIAALPLGNSNYQFFGLAADVAQDYSSESIHYQNDDHCMTIRMRPFDNACVFTSTGGRFAWWLEKQGVDASRDYLQSALVDIFGAEIRSHLGEFKVSAWGFDPWVRGAYSSQLPETSANTSANIEPRRQLAEPLDEKIYFAGEATSLTQFNTAHGAYLSGKAAVKQIVDSRHSA